MIFYLWLSFFHNVIMDLDFGINLCFLAVLLFVGTI
jgi:hypothetical protein